MALSFIRKRSPFKPTDITGCQLWLDGNDPAGTGILPSDTSVVSTWVDKSGLGNNGSQVNSPTYALSQKAVYFTGSSQYFTLPNGTFPTGDSSYSYFMITTFTNLGPNWSGVLGGGGYGTVSADTIAFRTNGAAGGFIEYWWGNDLGSTYTFSTNQIVSIEGQYTSGGIRNLTQNFTNVTSGTPGTRNQAATNNTIGRTSSVGNEYMKGYIHEIICYNNALSTTQQTQIQGYLAQKWNLKANLPQNHPGLKGIIYPTVPLQTFTHLQYSSSFLPTQVGSCQLWLDASDSATVSLSGANVTQWTDKSTNAAAAIQNNSLGYPTYVSGATPYVLFSANQALRIASWNYSSSWTVILAMNTVSLGARWFISPYDSLGLVYMGMNEGGNKVFSGLLSSGAGDVTGSHIESTMAQDTSTTGVFNYYRDGQIQSTNTVYAGINSITGRALGIGANQSGNFDIGGTYAIYELLIFNSFLSDPVRYQVEGYLAWKWGLQANLPSNHLYKNASPSITNVLGINRPANLPARSIAMYATARPIV